MAYACLAVLVVAQSELVKAKARGQSVMTWHLGGMDLQELGQVENCCPVTTPLQGVKNQQIAAHPVS